MSKLSHTDPEGKAIMVDVTPKPPMHRVATAEGFIKLQNTTIQLISENQMKKGDVLTVAEIAGIQAAKQTSNLIPLCHPLPLTAIKVKATLQDKGVMVTSEVKCTSNTGVEMEALTAVNVALLTVYDMCKAVDKQMVITDIRLLNKTKTAF
ncbi:MAG: cyclic pyranopterin monophosphate synthase MoaC [Bacteroidetes bacterium HGW-Bacteroidetes-1]|jgi:cyclic pyranopterin phosphate synthase|nr:MAG: cyclic pyranopterin monophosphate synthase MoaC [Bacteroidetes bacterium HGW-Bacteroidetes-1]